MSDFKRKLIARLIGVVVLAIGSAIGWYGLNEHARRMGGPDSNWIRTSAEITSVEPDPRGENRVLQTYSFISPGGAAMSCDVGSTRYHAADAGETTTIYVRIDTAPGFCRISTKNLDAGFTGAHFLMIFALVWIGMGTAFIIRPPKNVGSGGHGGGSFGGFDGGGGGNGF